MQSLRVVLAAEEGAGVGVLQALVGSTHKVVAVLTSPPGKRAFGATPFALARRLGLSVLPANRVRDPRFADELRREKVDVLLNVHSLHIITPAVLDAPLLGSYNLHPGPLPRYAGLNAPSWAILRGERAHGVTVHRMLPGIDTGPVAYQSLFPIDDGETGFSLSSKCVREGLSLMRRFLD